MSGVAEIVGVTKDQQRVLLLISVRALPERAHEVIS
jgi:hypothetical protein